MTRIPIGAQRVSPWRPTFAIEAASPCATVKATASEAPCDIARRATSSSRSRRRAATASLTPSCASASATPSPIPELAPVTSATLPRIPRSISGLLPQGLIGAVEPVLPGRVAHVGVERVLEGLGAVRQVRRVVQDLAGAHLDLLVATSPQPEAARAFGCVRDLGVRRL